MFQKTLIAGAIAAMAFSSCTKEDVVPTPVAPAKSKSEMLQATPWKLTAWSGTMEGTTEVQDFYDLLLDACDHDDQFRFKAQGLMEHDQMTDMCEAGEPKVVAANWTYNSTNNQLSFNASGFEVVAVVSQLNDSSLQLQFTKDLLGVNFDHVWTFKKY